MNSPQQIIKITAAAIHRELLKDLGFKKTGNTWTSAEKWPEVINLQSSSSNSSEEVKVTFNLGIFIAPIRVIWETPPIGTSIKEYDCDIRTRIGQLFPNPHDKWWTAQRGDSPENLTAEMVHSISLYGIPWLEKPRDLRGVASEFSRCRMNAKAAVAFHLAGDFVSASEEMMTAYSKSSVAFRSKLRTLATKLQISLSD